MQVDVLAYSESVNQTRDRSSRESRILHELTHALVDKRDVAEQVQSLGAQCNALLSVLQDRVVPGAHHANHQLVSYNKDLERLQQNRAENSLLLCTLEHQLMQFADSSVQLKNELQHEKQMRYAIDAELKATKQTLADTSKRLGNLQTTTADAKQRAQHERMRHNEIINNLEKEIRETRLGHQAELEAAQAHIRELDEMLDTTRSETAAMVSSLHMQLQHSTETLDDCVARDVAHREQYHKQKLKLDAVTSLSEDLAAQLQRALASHTELELKHATDVDAMRAQMTDMTADHSEQLRLVQESLREQKELHAEAQNAHDEAVKQVSTLQDAHSIQLEVECAARAELAATASSQLNQAREQAQAEAALKLAEVREQLDDTELQLSSCQQALVAEQHKYEAMEQQLEEEQTKNAGQQECDRERIEELELEIEQLRNQPRPTEESEEMQALLSTARDHEQLQQVVVEKDALIRTLEEEMSSLTQQNQTLTEDAEQQQADLRREVEAAKENYEQVSQDLDKLKAEIDDHCSSNTELIHDKHMLLQEVDKVA